MSDQVVGMSAESSGLYQPVRALMPNGTVQTIVVGQDFIDKSFVVVLFYPTDFSELTASEFESLTEVMDKFKDFGCQVIIILLNNQ